MAGSVPVTWLHCYVGISEVHLDHSLASTFRQCCQVHKVKICEIVLEHMPNKTKICQIFFATKNTWKIGSKIVSYIYEVHCTIDDSYKHSLGLSTKNNPFPARNRTLRCYRANFSPAKVPSSALRNAWSMKYN